MCPRCKCCTISKDLRVIPICPSYQYYDYFSHSGGGKLYIAQGLLRKLIDFSPEIARIVYQCLLCGACKELCPPGFETIEIFRDLRRELVDRGLAPLGKQKSLISNIKKYNNPYGNAYINKEKWTEGLNPLKKIADDKSYVIYYSGCAPAYDKKSAQISKNIAFLLQKAKVDFAILGNDENCCGSIPLELGDISLFKKLARKNIKMINNSGAELVITSCPHCYEIFNKEYPEIDSLNFEVMHTTEFLERQIDKGKLKITKKTNLVATYHDPCHLGRYSNVYKSPRNILKSIKGLKLLEMERNKEQAYCCGSGTGVKSVFPDFSQFTGKERLNEAKKTGAHVIITACPYCQNQFSELNHSSNKKIKIIDIHDLLAESI